jgi:hypothetical protein
VTVTGTDGIAIGHGCARLPKKPKTGITAALTLPSRANLTITAGRLAELAAASALRPSGLASWSFTRNDDRGPPGGFGI